MSTVSDYTLILIGKTGVGKSATGNVIIGETKFIASDTGKSCTTKSQVEQSDNLGYNIIVLDTPGVMDTAVNSDEAKAKTCREMIEAISKCPDSKKRALCLVLKYSDRFTEENKKSLYILTRVFGEEFLAKSCVIIFTYGDLFDTEYEGEKSFDEWCREQTDDLAQLLNECKYRCVLFKNKTKKLDIRTVQFKHLIEYVEALDESYTDAKFTEAKKKHKRLLLEAILIRLVQNFDTMNRSLEKDIDTVMMNEVEEKQLRVLKKKGLSVLNEIDMEDEGVFYDNNEVSLLADQRLCTQKIIKKCDVLIRLARIKQLNLKIQNDVMSLMSKCINCTPSQCSLETLENLEQEMNDLFDKYKRYGLDFSSGDGFIKICQPSIDYDGNEAVLSEEDLHIFNDVIKQFSLLTERLNKLKKAVFIENNKKEIQRETESLRREFYALSDSDITRANLIKIKEKVISLLLRWDADETMSDTIEPLRELKRQLKLRIKSCERKFRKGVIANAFAMTASVVSAVGGAAGGSTHIVAQVFSRAAPGLASAVMSAGDIVSTVLHRD